MTITSKLELELELPSPPCTGKNDDVRLMQRIWPCQSWLLPEKRHDADLRWRSLELDAIIRVANDWSRYICVSKLIWAVRKPLGKVL